jgi:hypothetical protein
MDAQIDDLQAKFEEMVKKVNSKYSSTVKNFLQSTHAPFTTKRHGNATSPKVLSPSDCNV